MPELQNNAVSSVAPITEESDKMSAALTLTTISLSEINVSDLPTKRKRIRWAVELNGCFCGNVLTGSSSTAGVIECKRTGCETQWVSRMLHCLY